MPNGRSIILERQPGADPGGMLGFRTSLIFIGGGLFKRAVVDLAQRRDGIRSDGGNGDSAVLQAFRHGQGFLSIRLVNRSFGAISTCSHPDDPTGLPGAGNRQSRSGH
jgi:hypothetical protein